MARLEILGKSPVGFYLRLSETMWNLLPPSVTELKLVRSYGHFLHSLVRLQSPREMSHGTFFLRNRPELELIQQLASAKVRERPLQIAVLGASNGAEVYSFVWAIRSRQPNANLVVHAVDISATVVEFARQGIYSLTGRELVGDPIFERLTEMDMEDIFDRRDGRFRVKSWIREGIVWHVGDAGDPRMRELLGPQDIVVANRFLCHMPPAEAEASLRSIARLVTPGGHLFVSGVDLDVRTKVALDLGWKPVRQLLEAIHEGDPSLRRSWPCKYWGLEPLDTKRPDWQIRYASAFQLGGCVEAGASMEQLTP
jgi:SAM-dependent methyltransferase